MTPERRDELRRADDAVKHARYTLDRKNYMATIDEQEGIIEGQDQSISELKSRIKALESLLARAGDKLTFIHELFVSECVSYYQPTVDILKEIDAILPATEGDKNAHIS